MPAPLTVIEQSAHFLDRPHEGLPDAPIVGPANWRVVDLPPIERLRRSLAAAEVAALRAGIDALADAGDEWSAADFAVEPAGSLFACWRRELQEGRGFVLARGIPVDLWSRSDLDLMMRGIASQFGRLGMQNARGDVIGEVRNTGAAARDAFVRNYVTNREFRFHCDAADVLGLLCLRKAARGGRSLIASSVAVFNELRARRPDLAARLFEPLLLDLRNEQAEGAPGFGAVTPCAFAGGRLRTIYISDYFRSVVRHAEVTLSDADVELMDLYEQIAADSQHCLGFDLEPGDLLLVNNHVTLHARTAFEDLPGRERLLLRFLASISP